MEVAGILESHASIVGLCLPWDVDVYLAIHVACFPQFVHLAFVYYLKMSIQNPFFGLNSLIACGPQEVNKHKITLGRQFYMRLDAAASISSYTQRQCT